MKTQVSPKKGDQGNVLVTTLVITGLLAIVLASYLTMIGSQNTMTARSQGWNTCIAIAEAGIEEAFGHLNMNGATNANLISNGWGLKNGAYFMSRSLDNGYYEVAIVTGLKPVITSTGYAPAPLTLSSVPGPFLAAAGETPSATHYISRTVQVVCKAQGASLSKAIVARDRIDLKGKDVNVDSFHSYDPNGSSYTNGGGWGLYDAAKRRENGDVAVIAGLHDDLKISKSLIRGRVSTGPDGNIKVDKNAVVGSLAWHDGGNKGVQPGWSSDDANFAMPAIARPFNSGIKPIGGFVGTNYYDVILPSGDWKINQFEGKVYVAGDARLLVTSKMEFKDGSSDDDGIEFGPGARLQLYVECKEAKLVGKKRKKKDTSQNLAFNEEGNATNFLYYGLDKNEKLTLSKMDEFVGVIYAPNAAVTIKGGNAKYYKCNVFGSVSGLKVTMERSVNFHYDENIASTDGLRTYVIESWKEL